MPSNHNPLTPPNESSSDAIDNNVTSTTSTILSGPNDYPIQQVATPVSTSMGSESADTHENKEERADMSDEDQDMSDGGAALTMTLSHNEELNAELDLLDAELMGPENLADLYLDQYPAFGFYPEEEEDPGQPEGGMNMYMQGAIDTTNLPTSLSAVSLQLQHIQEGQEHMEAAEAVDEQHAFFVNNSTPSILFPSLSSPATSNVSHGNASQAEFVAMGEISPVNVSQAPAGLASSHLSSIGGLNPTPAATVVDTPLLDQAADASHPFFSNLSLTDPIWETNSDFDPNEVDDQSNFNLADFLYNWGVSASLGENSKRPHLKGPSLPALHQQRSQKLTPLQRHDLQGDKCDIQRINWVELEVSRLEARVQRRRTYRNYTNLGFSHQWHPRLNGARLPDDQNFLRFRRMDFDQNVNLAHFQLRNLMACASRDHVFYAGKSKILQWNPRSGMAPATAMDLTDPVVQPWHNWQGQGIQISTLTVAHDILVAGGFCGEYGLVNLKAPKDAKHTEGLITDHQNSITNHVQVHLSRHSSLPLASFASNDMGVRTLDISTNKFIAEHKYDHAINCTAVSPDQRLRVLVGDTRSVLICNAETGEILQSLEGHRDFGFACDWADDGWTVATGNQDMQVKIWDARKWKTSNGLACPIATVAAEMAGVRKLKFSPLGSGKRLLLAAEPADFINVIDAESFTSKQTLSFFGEIGGLDFTNDGQDLLVANCDSMRGGIMQFERCDLASSGLHYLQEYEDKKYRKRYRRRCEGYDWTATEGSTVSHPKSSGTHEQRHRKAAALGVTMGHF